MEPLQQSNNSVELGNTCFGIAVLCKLLSIIITWIALGEVKEILSATASFFSIGAGVMAIRYYFYSTKKIKEK